MEDNIYFAWVFLLCLFCMKVRMGDVIDYYYIVIKNVVIIIQGNGQQL